MMTEMLYCVPIEAILFNIVVLSSSNQNKCITYYRHYYIQYCSMCSCLCSLSMDTNTSMFPLLDSSICSEIDNSCRRMHVRVIEKDMNYVVLL